MRRRAMFSTLDELGAGLASQMAQQAAQQAALLRVL